MDLKNTINNTNTQKENIKTVAIQIDTKLIELGGERATNLNDVVNKMSTMVTTQYKKIATGEIKTSKSAGMKVEVNTNLEFNPSRIFARISSIGTSGNDLCVDSEATLIIPNAYGGIRLSIENISKVKFDFVSANSSANLNSKVINWIALG